MKKLLTIIGAALMLSFVGRAESDDSGLWDAINKLEEEQEQLKDEHDQMQEQFEDQQALLNALTNNLSIVSVTPTEEGYVLTFSVTIKHGEKGEAGADGQDGDSLFESVTWDEKNVYITLADGTVITLPLAMSDANEIWYTTIDGNVIEPYNPSAFGANIVSKEWDSATGNGVITFDGTVTKIGVSAFESCSSLTSITIPNSVTEIGDNAFRSCSSLTSITIPDSVTKIEEWAFYYCWNLTSITIPNSVTAIGDLAFSFCSSLTSVTIPDSVTEIGWFAFQYCSNLTSVYCKAITPPTGGASMFEYNDSGRKIYVPAESVEAYKSAEYWSVYADDIVGYDFE